VAPPEIRDTFGEILRPALVGHRGAPQAARAVVRFDDEVDRIAGVIRSAAPPGPVHLAGYSLGGRVALGLLARHPALFSGATLVGAHPGLADAADRERRVAADARWIRILRDDGLEAFVRAWEAQPLFATQRDRAAPGALAAQAETRRAQDPEGLARALEVLGLGAMPPRWRALADIEVPQRWLVGGLDEKFGALAERAVATSPRARLVRVPGVGHNVLLESPGAFWETWEPQR